MIGPYPEPSVNMTKNKFAIKSDVYGARGTKTIDGPWKPTREEAFAAFWAKLRKTTVDPRFNIVFLAERANPSQAAVSSKDVRGTAYNPVVDEESLAWLKRAILDAIATEDRLKREAIDAMSVARQQAQNRRWEQIVDSHMQAMKQELRGAGMQTFGVAGGMPYRADDGGTRMHLFYVIDEGVTVDHEPVTPARFVGDVVKYMSGWDDPNAAAKRIG